MMRKLTLTLLALALAGCASAPPAKPRATLGAQALPVLQPSVSAQLEPQLAIDRWWTLFDDPALDRLIAQALQRNLDLTLAAARVREARARLDEAHGAEGPTLDLQARSARARSTADSLPPGADRTGSGHGVSLAARYELDLWGRLDAASDAARARLLAQEWARASIEWSLTAQLAEAHFGLRAVQRQIEISEAVRASRATTLSLRQRERQAGIGNELDLRRVEAELSGTDVTLAGLRRQRTALESTIALLSGRPLAELAAAEPAREALNPAQPFVTRLPQGDAAALLLRRPDVRQAEAQLAAANADVAAARAATLPSISLSGSAGSDARSLAGLFNGPAMVWSLALGAAQNVFDGGQARARVQQADARGDAALASYRKTVLAAVLELREAYAALDLTLQAQQAEQQRVASLERAQALARLGYASGAFGYLDLLDAERNSYQAQLNEVAAQRDRLIGQVAAFKALGGGHTGARHPASTHS